MATTRTCCTNCSAVANGPTHTYILTVDPSPSINTPHLHVHKISSKYDDFKNRNNTYVLEPGIRCGSA